MKIGFIGLGIMGSRMAANLQHRRHALSVHNRSRDKAGPLLAHGARWCDTPAALAGEVDVVVTMLSTPDVVEQTAFGPDGFVPGLRAGALWVDCSTVHPSFSRRMAEAARAHGVRFLDAPVAGSKAAAEKAQLVFLVGGADEDVAACRLLFDAMGRAVNHVGGNGMGTAMKLVVNLMIGHAMVAFAEGMALGESLGIERAALLDALLGGPAAAPFLTLKRPRIESGDMDDPDFPLQWMRKDLELAATTAFEQGVALPVTNLAKEIYAMAVQRGLGELDYAAMYQFLGRPRD
jgi:3-hydroxyisobutyrate dehydrogenase/glyoxylate/succinic semialdehyde reductase